MEVDVELGSGSNDPRSGCGCAAALAMVFLVLVAASFVMHHKRQVEVAVVLLGLMVLAYAARRHLNPQRWLSRNGPAVAVAPRPLANVVPGGPVFTMGIVAAKGEHPAIPFSSGTCAWSRVRITVDGTLVGDVRTADAIVLDDGAGAAVEVDVSDPDIAMKTTAAYASTVDAPHREVLDYCAERGLAKGRTDIDVVVDWLPLQEILFVRGRVVDAGESTNDGAYRASDRTKLRIVADGSKKVRISSDGS